MDNRPNDNDDPPTNRGGTLAQQSRVADQKAADLSSASSIGAPLALVIVISALADLFAQSDDRAVG